MVLIGNMFESGSLKKANPYYLFIPLYTVIGMMGLSYWTAFDFKINSLLFWMLFVVCMVSNIFLYGTYSFKKAILHIVITVLVWVSAEHTHRAEVFYCWLILLAVPPISFKDITKTVLVFNSAALVIILSLTAAGVCPNIVFARLGWLDRYSFGFMDPNIFSAYILQVCMALVYLRWKDFGAKDNLFLFAAFCLVTFFANSRTSAILLVLLVILVNLTKFLLKNRLKIYFILANSMLVLCPVLSFIAAKLYCLGIPFALSLDEFMSYRLRNVCFCMTEYPVTLFGSLFRIRCDMQIMANLYGILFIRYGVIAFLLFITGFALLIRKTYLKKNLPLLILIIVSLVQAVSEQYFLMPYMNFTALAFAGLLNNKKQ